MREIKFRAWDGKYNKMRSHEDLLEMTKEISKIPLASGVFLLPIRQRVKLMQYTGLKDKNGNEIYEGDIVKVYNGQTCVVKYGEYQSEMAKDLDETFYLDIDGDQRMAVGFYVKDLSGYCECLDSRTDKWVEVIGNTFENPELLGELNEC